MITTSNLSFHYANDKTLQFDDVSLDGEAVIVGKSGRGKTTLLHLLAGILTPTTGTITINDTIISNLSKKDMDKFRGSNIGLIFQRPHYIKSLTVGENLQIIQKVGVGSVNKNQLEKLLSSLELASDINTLPSHLSEGQKQRLSIAFALINMPSIILADEPTSSLDDENCERVISLIKKEAKEKGAQLITITHDQRVKNYFKQQIEL